MKQWRLFLGSQRKLRFSSCCLTCFLRGLQINHGMQSVLPLPGRNLVTPLSLFDITLLGPICYKPNTK